MKFRHLILLIAAISTSVQGGNEPKDDEDEREVEREIHEAFKAAFSNRSDEVQDFFNKTFGPGGNETDIAERFKEAWGSTSEGVKRFVNETYWNISRIMTGNDSDNSVSTRASLGYDSISEKINAYTASSNAKKEKTTPKPENPHGGILDTAWNYFKSVFGVNPKPTPSPHHKSIPNTVPPPSAAVPVAPSPVPHQGGLYVGILAMCAALFVLLQSMFNRNSLVNNRVSSKSSWQPQQRSQVPSGYVRIA